MMQTLRDLVLTFSRHESSQRNIVAPRSKALSASSSHKRSRSQREAQGSQTQVLNWAQKTLRAPQNQRVRVNQFEIDEHYQGLIEKFFVLNREDLANALEDCVQKLGSRSHDGCIPEVLSLLLELSDDPLTTNDLDNLKDNGADSIATPSALKWADIIKDDPLSDDDLWRDEHYDTSSDDENIVESEPKTPDRTRNRSRNQVDTSVPQATNLLIPIDESLLSDIDGSLQISAKQRDRGDDVVSEAYLVREVLTMLRGAPCSTYYVRDDHVIDLSSRSDNVKTLTLTNDSILESLQGFVSLGSALCQLRHWLQLEQNVPFYQRLRSAIANIIDVLNRRLSDFEALLINSPRSDAGLYGLISLDAHLQHSSPVIDDLAAILKDQAAQLDEILFLNLMYDRLCIVDAALNSTVFDQLYEVWSDVLEIHLRLLDHWMSQGVLQSRYGECMVEVSPGSSQSSAPCSLRRDADGRIKSPKFITDDMTERVLNAGRTVRIMDRIDPDTAMIKASVAPWKSVSQDDQAASDYSIAPFSQQLDAQLNTWISANSSQSFDVLKQHLWSRCHLERHLDALDYLYLSRDGSLFGEMAQGLLDRLVKARGSGHNGSFRSDNLSLSEVVREAFISCAAIDGSRIIVNVVKGSSAPGRAPVLVDVDALRLTYKLSWPTSLILPDLRSYQKFQSLLLRTISAKQFLCATAPLSRGLAIRQRRRLGVRRKLIWFVDILRHYLLEVIAVPSTGRLRRCLAEASSLDAMADGYTRFTDYISAVILESKNARPLREALHEMLDLAVQYHASCRPQSSSGSKREIARASRAASSPERSEGDNESPDSEVEGYLEAETFPDSHRATTANASLGASEIDRKFDQLLRFLLAGLRGIATSDSRIHQAYQTLAERLECTMIVGAARAPS